MKKRKQILGLLLVMIIMTLVSGCASGLSEKFDEKKVKEKAGQIAELSCTGKITDAYNMLSDMMKTQITEEQIRTAIEGTIQNLGEYKKISGINITGQKDKDTGTEYAVAIVMTQFDEGKAQFTISFDTAMNCVGFYIK